MCLQGLEFYTVKASEPTKIFVLLLFSDTLNTKSSSQNETVILLRSTVNALDKEKDSLQESIDEKTERIAYLEDNLANKVFKQNRKWNIRTILS